MQEIAPHAREYGDKFLNVVRDRERANPRFEFLRDENVSARSCGGMEEGIADDLRTAAFLSVLRLARRSDLHPTHRSTALQRRGELLAPFRVARG
jgi:hypothetical protein